MADYRNLEVWQKAMKLTMMIYDAADTFPNHERYGLVSQMERAAVSIPSNIAEGYGRQSDKEFYHFLSIARGSLYELQTQVYIASGRSYMSEERTNKINQRLEAAGSAGKNDLRIYEKIGKREPKYMSKAESR